MQAFLPYPNIPKSLECLDDKRLGKQRVEAMQIYNVLTVNKKARWRHHPAVLMWRRNIDGLAYYHNCCIREWKKRGFHNTMGYISGFNSEDLPTWFGNERFHASHRSNLLRKDEEFYRKFGWKEPVDIEYVWPVTWDAKRQVIVNRRI